VHVVAIPGNFLQHFLPPTLFKLIYGFGIKVLDSPLKVFFYNILILEINKRLTIINIYCYVSILEKKSNSVTNRVIEKVFDIFIG